ncbi:MAG: glycosyltransferase family 2 protein [Bacteroidales bacterium]|nr:glycosyltransferase family 2 protein [Bacteroidales bacterium]
MNNQEAQGKPDVSVVTVNFNGYDLTCCLIDSLQKIQSCNLEIIVVDNGSNRNEAQALAEKYPYVKTVRSVDNLGFAGGNNLALPYVHGDYVFYLNNDTEVEEDGFGALVDMFEKNPDVGIVCPKIRFFDQPRKIQFAGYTELSPVTLRNNLIGYDKFDHGVFNHPAESAYAHGAAMMVRKKALDVVGPMPECYFLYYEEIDWSVMFKRAGWKIMYNPACTVFHKESASSGKHSPLRCYYITRNRLLFAKRNLKGARYVLSVIFQVLISFPKRALTEVVHGRCENVVPIWQGVNDFFKMKDV